MTPERWQQVARVYESVLEQTPVNRAAFLAETCRDDSDLRLSHESIPRGLLAARFLLGMSATRTESPRASGTGWSSMDSCPKPHPLGLIRIEE